MPSPSLEGPLPLGALPGRLLPVLLLFFTQEHAGRPDGLSLNLDFPLVKLCRDVSDGVKGLGEPHGAVLAAPAVVDVDVVGVHPVDGGEGLLDVLALDLGGEAGEGNDAVLLPLQGLNYKGSLLRGRLVVGALVVGLLRILLLLEGLLGLGLLVVCQPVLHDLDLNDVGADLNLLGVFRGLGDGLSGAELDEGGAHGGLGEVEMGLGLLVAKADKGDFPKLGEGRFDVVNGDGKKLRGGRLLLLFLGLLLLSLLRLLLLSLLDGLLLLGLSPSFVIFHWDVTHKDGPLDRVVLVGERVLPPDGLPVLADDDRRDGLGSICNFGHLCGELLDGVEF